MGMPCFWVARLWGVNAAGTFTPRLRTQQAGRAVSAWSSAEAHPALPAAVSYSTASVECPQVPPPVRDLQMYVAHPATVHASTNSSGIGSTDYSPPPPTIMTTRLHIDGLTLGVLRELPAATNTRPAPVSGYDLQVISLGKRTELVANPPARGGVRLTGPHQDHVHARDRKDDGQRPHQYGCQFIACTALVALRLGAALYRTLVR